MTLNEKQISLIMETLKEVGGTDSISSLLADARRFHGLIFPGNLADFESALQKAGFRIEKKLAKSGPATFATYISLPPLQCSEK